MYQKIKKEQVVLKKENENQIRRRKGIKAKFIIKKVKKNKLFAGLFTDKQLKNINILKHPISIVVLIKNHWIAIYISSKIIILFDSLSQIFHDDYVNIRHFLQKHSIDKQIITSPVLQSSNSDICGLYVIYFVNEIHNNSFCDLMKPFSDNLFANDKFICNYAMDYF